MSEHWYWRATGESGTRALGAAVGRAAEPGLVLGLTGALGAGKTCFVQGLAQGLDVPPEHPVTSPTFALVQYYAGRLNLVHVDAYRLTGPADLRTVDADDWLDGTGVVAIEWADRIAAALPSATIWCMFQHINTGTRAIEVRGDASATLSTTLDTLTHPDLHTHFIDA